MMARRLLFVGIAFCLLLAALDVAGWIADVMPAWLSLVLALTAIGTVLVLLWGEDR
jgi:hypothetical protein